MKFIDLFCGIGGFRIGFERNGFECIFSSDFDQKVREVYKDNFNEEPFGDITQVVANEIPDFDVLTAGFPCQPFSISGLKKGFGDTRGTLFFDICRIIEEKKPKVVVLENVKHLIHHDKRRTINVILSNLKDLGYNVNYKVLNAKDFGLPQNRERIFIVGSLNGTFEFDLMEKKQSKPLRHFLESNSNSDFEFLNNDEFTILDQDLVNNNKQSGLIFIGYRNKNGFKKGVRPGTIHLNRAHRQPNRIYDIDGYHPTLPSQEPSGRFFVFDKITKKVRKLTIKECYKIMGFPENFRLSDSLATCYKQIGNSVAVNITDELSKQLVKQGLLENDFKGNSQDKIIGDLFPMY